jgi:hypothetical protein
MTTTKLILYKKLTELGVKIDSEYVWVDKFPIFNDKEQVVTAKEFQERLDNSMLSLEARKLVKIYPAPIAEELGELLPWEVNLDKAPHYLEIRKVVNWEIAYRRNGKESICFEADTLTNDMAEMVIFLKSQNLI